MGLVTEIILCAAAGVAVLLGLAVAVARSIVTDKDMEGY